MGTVPRDWRMSSVVQCAILRLEIGCVTVSQDLSVKIAMNVMSENYSLLSGQASSCHKERRKSKRAKRKIIRSCYVS